MKRFSIKEYLFILIALAIAIFAILNYFDIVQIDLLFIKENHIIHISDRDF